MLPPAILLESRLLILASPRIIRKSAQEATRVLFLTLFSGGIFMAAIAKRAQGGQGLVGKAKEIKPACAIRERKRAR
ncbi:hypothetical protein OJE16_24820 [Pantoea tagorei]|uniref:hypothetical protein n=1 Tax=Pantoea TaxID=53335 RepID=UPI000CDD3CCD|nr:MULTISPECIES: hypothetical protein [Pantoea]MCG7367196.1 hypothetical protein [Pantoea sp. ACRSH]MCG7396058.1 hypothetical protein [Pantoea sp. ACRSC]POW51589.1 hypothetical protein C3408_25025 [Pantoea alvi]UBN54743.1 hypothetical protein LB453_03935 [Pantoea agglomerans]